MSVNESFLSSSFNPILFGRLLISPSTIAAEGYADMGGWARSDVCGAMKNLLLLPLPIKLVFKLLPTFSFEKSESLEESNDDEVKSPFLCSAYSAPNY